MPRPVWSVPADIARLVAAHPELIWEDDSWAPIVLTVMGGTTYQGRAIPLAWQIAFEPKGLPDEVNAKLENAHLDANGFGWSTWISTAMGKRYPELESALHFDDESAACVIWVETEAACRCLMETVWELTGGA